ncbi:MAG: 5-bromo-4-chloroindolyl phosphate hydrolysis protein, partial [Clostridia bacterium]
MDKKDFSDLEEQIMSTVSNALKAIDFANLKNDINDKTDYTLHQFKSKFNEYSEKYINLNKKSKKDVSTYISKRPRGSISGILYILFGSGGSFIYGSSILTILIFKGLVSSIVIPGSYIVFRFSLVLFMVSLGLLARGIILRKRVKRFKKYISFIDDNSYFLIKDLAEFYNKKESFIVKDLSKMIDSGMFLEGHIDEEKTYFILNNELYNEYLNLKKEQIAEESNNKKLNEEIYNSG